MGEARRRRDSGEGKLQKVVLPPQFAGITAEGKGAWRIGLWGVADLADADDLIRRAVRHFIEVTAKALQPPGCLICKNEAPRIPLVVALVCGHCDNPNQMIVSALCDTCSAKPSRALLDQVTAYFLKALPGIARKVNIHSSSGRA